MKRRLIGFLFVCSLVCAGTVRTEVQDEEATRLNTSFNQVIKLEIDNLCNVLGGTELFSKVCTMLMSVTNIELLTTTTVVPKVCTILDTVTSMMSAGGVCDPTPITTSPVTITDSGHYCVADDLTGLVTIAGSDITLDLNGYNLSGGILFDKTSPRENIVIRNGFCAVIAGNSVGSSVSNLVIEDMPEAGFINFVDVNTALVRNCVITAGFITFSSSSSVRVLDCSVERGAFSGPTLQFSGVSRLTLENVRASQIIPTNQDVLQIVGCQAVKVVNCLFQGGLNGVSVARFAGAGDCDAVLFDNCSTYSAVERGFFLGDITTANNVQMCKCSAMNCGTVGFDLEKANRAVLRDCVASDNKADGFAVLATSSDVLLHGCKANANGDDGFDLTAATGGGHHVQECLSLNNTGTGFVDAGTPNATYVANFATDNGTGLALAQYTVGITNVAAAAGVTFWENVRI